MRKIIALCFLVALQSTSAHAERFVCVSDNGQSPYPYVASSEHNHTRFAPANGREHYREFAAYVSSFDGDDDDNGDGRPDYLANPVWVAYQLIGLDEGSNEYEEPDISITRPNDWYKASDLSFLWTNRPSVRRSRIDNSYDGVGNTWNRGHFAMSDHAQRISWQASCNTHLFWNASPQAANLNQGPWRHLENYTAALSNYYGSAWIITGPIFYEGTRIRYIGDRGEVPVAVPHAFFKVIVIETDDGVDTRSFIFEQPSTYRPREGIVPYRRAARQWINCSDARRLNYTYDHRSRMVSLETLEQRTGLDFRSNIPITDAQAAEQHEALWPIPEEYWSASSCGGQNYVLPSP